MKKRKFIYTYLGQMDCYSYKVFQYKKIRLTADDKKF